MKIALLLHNAYGIGGTIRSTMNLASALVARHDVEIVSVFRTEDRPKLTVSGKVRITPLIDKRDVATTYDGEHELMSLPSLVFPPTEVLADSYTRLADERVKDFLRNTDADVVIATRPGLVLYLAEFGKQRYLRIGQEHLTYDAHDAELRATQNAAIAELDAFVAVSEADAAIHRERLPGISTRLTGIPNAVPAPKTEPSDGTAKLVVAAGRLVEVKRYDLLIQAFAKVAAERQDWQLRLYGRGPERASLRALIDELELNDHVFLMGAHSPLETEWAKGSIAAVSSDQESFGMTIVEAMHAGLAVVATDCPHGPGEIISHGTDGLLVPVGDPDPLADALLQLINDDEQRRAMAALARESARRYQPQHVAAQYEQLISELLVARRTPLTAFRARLRRAAGTALGPLRPRRSPPKPQPTSAHEPTTPTALKALRAKAGCTVNTDGDIVIRVHRAGLTGADLSLVLKQRGSDAEPIRLPLPSLDGTTGRLRTTIRRAEHRLSEGRWDLYVERADDGKRRRMTAGLVEQRGLLTLPRPGCGPVTSWIPYTTQDGYLAIRTWRRPTHAEVETVRAAPEAITVHATLLGDDFGDAPPIVDAVSRNDPRHTMEIVAERQGEHGVIFTLPHTCVIGARASDHDVWDLRLRHRTDVEPASIGRILGDLVERRATDVYPAQQLTCPGRAPAKIRPFFTVTNDLAVSVKDVAKDT